MRTILAPGVEWFEHDKSQYSPAMVGTNCFVMGFTNKGEPYQPMEFTSQAAWASYYGTPDNEAERYAYAAACEVLNQRGRLYFARLPYDNAAFNKVVGFKYKLDTDKQILNEVGKETPYFQIKNVDETIDNYTEIQPGDNVALYDLSAIDEYRTGEATVANNTFVIADMAFNTYDKISEDSRKNNKREMIGIMPVITTAANAMYAQKLIDVDKEDVIGYETIGSIHTLDATSLSDIYPKLAEHTANIVKKSDMCRLINTKDYYRDIKVVDIRVVDSIDVYTTDDTQIKESIDNYINGIKIICVPDSWDGSYQLEPKSDDSELSVAKFSFMGRFTEADICDDNKYNLSSLYETVYKPMFGWHNVDGDDTVPDTVSQEANTFFPTIEFDGEKFDRSNLKKIGVVVYKMFLDPTEGNKINFEPVESYAGSLCKTDKDPNTGATTFIDTIINSQSKYINFFSNCFNTAVDKEYYNKKLDIFAVAPSAKHATYISTDDIKKVKDFIPAINQYSELLSYNIDITNIQDICTGTTLLFDAIKSLEDIEDIEDIDEEHINTLKEARDILRNINNKIAQYVKPDTVCPSLGFYSEMTKEDISISKSIYEGMNMCFEKVSDLNKLDIDIIPDAGIANIASFLKSVFGDKGPYDLSITDDVGNSLLGLWRCDSNNKGIKTWKTVEQKFDNFCKNVRRDCMFIADGPRPLVLAGQKKIIRASKPANTIDANILPNLKWISGLNTSYGACYVDWFEQADDYSGDFFWCPPSIKAMGVYINTDVNFNYWDAPAGLNRGVIAATDVAFSPTMKQAGAFYEKNFNYAINYPNDGIVLEGQKTLQTKPSAFDRVNVRRLFLRLERMSFKTSRYFVYEGNTAYTRQRLIDAIEPYFKEAKTGGGIYDYKIVCDESNNTPDSIDRNELHCAIGIKPVKTAEFIVLDFIALRTGGSWTEAGL